METIDLEIMERAEEKSLQNDEYGKKFLREVDDKAASISEKVANMEQCSDCRKLKQQYNLLHEEQAEIKRLLEDVRREYEVKSRECHEASTSLHELQTKLMRKSMHFDSLAFAVEGQVQEKTREYKVIKFKYAKETKERKELYNQIVEMKGNIRVFCRCRPLNLQEKEAGAAIAFDFESAKDGELTHKSAHESSKKVYKFDSVFRPEDNQEMVFQKTLPLVVSMLDGYNVCIFAYGQTGTGKTFTMEGTQEARGVNYRTLEELFRVIKEREEVFKYELTVSVLEVYNEQIRDLLVPESQSGVAAKRLEVRQVAEGVHHVPGLVEARVSNLSEVWEVLQTGSKARAVGATNANEHSSRSHCIHCVMVKGENLVNGECTRSKLWLIDLSGGERVAKTDAQGERLKEAQSINKSLSALGDVISALATKSPHIPFRNSKLTRLLQDSLGGDSKTLMFVQISPNENDVGETLCSLNFASRVRGIELGRAKKQVDGCKSMGEKVKQDIKNKDGQIRRLEETIRSLDVMNKAKDLNYKNIQEKVKVLESRLLIERKLATKIAEKQKEKQPYTLFCTNGNKLDNKINKKNEAMRPPLRETNGNKQDNGMLGNFPYTRDRGNKPEFAEEKTRKTAPPEILIFRSFLHKLSVPLNKEGSRVSLGTKTVKRRTFTGRKARRVVVRDNTKNGDRVGAKKKWEDMDRRWR